MPLHSKLVGQATAPMVNDVDARWIMAFAAGLGDTNPVYMDTTRGPVIAHPVFPVSVEWPTILAAMQLTGSEIVPGEHNTGIHAYHDIHIHRPIRVGDRLSTVATVIGVVSRGGGAHQTMRVDTHDGFGERVCTTYQLGIAPRMQVAGEACIEELPAAPDFGAAASHDAVLDIPVGAGAAHVYTECARIWSPIHTDRAIALSVGLPDILLHGTATLALATSALVNGMLGGDPARVTRVGGRFAAMVFMPSRMQLRVLAMGADRLRFEVLTEGSGAAIRDGFLCWAPR